ncbi:peptide ligase PGM1-related protein [Streptomyces sp. NPDC059650]|uniref:preATP grasp domain-containing protein n=1 Tax=Streptomyces sp. NPDC059650 TaxID=3346896 RepID=UPI003694EE3B
MLRLLIGNDWSEELEEPVGTGWAVQRLLWFARDGDVLVLPVPPEEEFLSYVTSLTGTRRDSIQVVVPPPGRTGTGALTADRLTDPALIAELREKTAGRPVDEVFALWPDAAVAAAADALGCPGALQGHAFLTQSGGLLGSSKAVFRALAAGVGAPLPDGAVCADPRRAEEHIVRLLDGGSPVILKQDFGSGSDGNEILSRTGDVELRGARGIRRLADRPAVSAYLAERWDWLTAGGRDRVVVERYHPGSRAYFAEFWISDAGIRLGGHGEMQYCPLPNAQVMPAPDLTGGQLDSLVDGGHRISAGLRAVGYRGILSADAVVTPQGEVLFTEYNGRATGSTHIYEIVGKRVVGPGFGTDRILLERVWPKHWEVPSFSAALTRLRESGHAYDPDTRRGAIILAAYHPGRKGVMLCFVDDTVGAALHREQLVGGLFAPAT